MDNIKKNRAFTLVELMVVMLIIGVGFMAAIPKLTETKIKGDPRISFFNDLIASHLLRARELGHPVEIIGFKGSPNIMTYDGKRLEIPNTSSVQSSKINGYETRGEEYAIRVYPDGICDYFQLTLKEEATIESVPLLLRTRYSNDKNAK